MLETKDQIINKKYKPVVLLVLDGFGVNPEVVESPWNLAKHPTFAEIEKLWPFTVLQASGIAVGLPWQEAGNSEVGHLTIGAGRAVYTALPRISNAIEDESFFKNLALLKAIEKVKQSGSSLHLLGLFSSGSVHAHHEHFYAILEFTKKQGIKKVYLHLFTDGRDAPMQEAGNFFKELKDRLEKDYPMALIVSLVGRHFAMNRDLDWGLVEKTYKMLVQGDGNKFSDAVDYIEEQYRNDTGDEFLEPAVLENENGEIQGRIGDNDAVVFLNFREDSARQLTRAFVDRDFKEFEREYLDNLLFVTMVEYDKNFQALVAFPASKIASSLGEEISRQGLKQLRIAETEKYAHVTYFFSGGWEKAFQGEDRILIPSPKTAHFDEVPEMSAEKVAQAVVDNLEKYDFILANFANADMVGHTGNFDSTIKAFEVLDKLAGEILLKVLELGGALMITGDHGNAEEKRYQITGEKRTEHTSNPVPFYLVVPELHRQEALSERAIKKEYQNIEGILTDIAPTILELMGLPKPFQMTGSSLLKNLRKKQDDKALA